MHECAAAVLAAGKVRRVLGPHGLGNHNGVANRGHKVLVSVGGPVVGVLGLNGTNRLGVEGIAGLGISERLVHDEGDPGGIVVRD